MKHPSVIIKRTLNLRQIALSNRFAVEVPFLSKLLKVEVNPSDDMEVALWFLNSCDENIPTHSHKRKFKVFVTSERFDNDGLIYLNTVTNLLGATVHVFEVSDEF